MKHFSREPWFINRILILIHYSYPHWRIFTTEDIQDKYCIHPLTSVLPRLEKIAPDWAYLSPEMPYMPPSDIDPVDYVVLYELYSDRSFNLGVYSREPDNHPFLVVYDNSETIQLKMFEFDDNEMVLLHDYY